MNAGLLSGFLNSLDAFPDRPALDVSQRTYSYQELGQIAAEIAAAVLSSSASEVPVTAFLAYRSLTAYAAIVGILAAGKGYVPLNPNFPTERTHRMFELSGADVLIVGKECIHALETLLPGLDRKCTILVSDLNLVVALADRFPQHRFISYHNDIPVHLQDVCTPLAVSPHQTAYLLFTSGSTGLPKGVPVSHKNVGAYVRYISQRYEVNPEDRFSQMFDMTFDLSVHDMFVAWERAACVYCCPQKNLMTPGNFICENELTMWFSVPSVAMFMSGYRLLKPNSLPTLRYSLFCGEALSATLAEQWQKAASNSIVENLYGPTETTIAIAHYRWDSLQSPAECVNGIVPIGWTFSGQQACIIQLGKSVEDEATPLAVQEAGELCLSGSQVTGAYLNNPLKTQQQFIKIPSLGDDLWYRTGDLAKQDEKQCFHYLGRIDNQVKILGHRVELGEIDTFLREVSGCEMAVSLAWPLREGHATGIVAFIAGKSMAGEKEIQNYCQKNLPDYMVPKKIYFIETMPLNVNGKIDRLKLQEILETKKV